MSTISLAVIGKNRQPIYIKEFHSSSVISNEVSDTQLFGIVQTSTSTSLSSPTDARSSRNTIKTLDCSIRQQFILHDALDQMEQWIEKSSNNATNHDPSVQQHNTPSAHDSMFSGLLCAIEDMRVYGYVTTTQIIFLLVIQDDADGTCIVLNDQRTIDETIKRLFMKIHRIYVEYILNPFTTIVTTNGSIEIESQRFHQKVHDCIESYNHALMR